MKQIKSSEAKAKFSELLDLVEQGETIAITRHGKVIAQIAPADDRRPADVVKAIEELKELRKGNGAISVEEILSWRDEGRRF
jgi:prevent-host-death family protein